MEEDSQIENALVVSEFPSGADPNTNLAESSSQMVVARDVEDSFQFKAAEESDPDYEPEEVVEEGRKFVHTRSSCTLVGDQGFCTCQELTAFSSAEKSSFQYVPVEEVPDPEDLIAMDIAQRDQAMEIERSSVHQSSYSLFRRKKDKK